MLATLSHAEDKRGARFSSAVTLGRGPYCAPRVWPAVADPSPAASGLLAERVLQQRARGDKWKARAQELGRQLVLLGAGSSARDAAVAERVLAAERQLEEQALRHKAQVQRCARAAGPASLWLTDTQSVVCLSRAFLGAEWMMRLARKGLVTLCECACCSLLPRILVLACRLQASLAGAQAARQELEQQLLASSAALGAAAAAAAAGAPAAGKLAVGGAAAGTAPGGSSSSAALLAELRARCETLERQLETHQAQVWKRSAALSSSALEAPCAVVEVVSSMWAWAPASAPRL